MSSHVEIYEGADLNEVRRRIAWLERLQMLRHAALPLAAIAALLGVMITPIIFPLVTIVILVMLAIRSRQARNAREGLLTDIENLRTQNLLQNPELEKFRSTIDRVTRGYRSEWSSVM